MASSKKRREGGLVWDSEVGAVCPSCGQRLTECACAEPTAPPAGDGVVRVGLERKGRGGKTVTVIRGLPLDPDGLAVLAKELKRRCGAGGKVADGCIELQGDRRDAVVELLQQRDYDVKRAGG